MPPTIRPCYPAQRTEACAERTAYKPAAGLPEERGARTRSISVPSQGFAGGWGCAGRSYLERDPGLRKHFPAAAAQLSITIFRPPRFRGALLPSACRSSIDRRSPLGRALSEPAGALQPRKLYGVEAAILARRRPAPGRDPRALHGRHRLQRALRQRAAARAGEPAGGRRLHWQRWVRAVA